MIVKRLAQSLRWRFERLAMLLERRRKALVVITYHRLYSQVLDTPFDEGVFGDMSQEYFALQLQWLKLNAEVISEGDVRLGLRCPGTLPQRGVLITFDDGYRDNYTLAYPVLRQMKLPALFFVPTQPLLERRLGWWDLAAYLVKQTKRPSLTLDGISYSLGGPEDRQRLIGVLLERFKTLPEARNQNLLTDLARDLDTVFPSSRLENAELMTFRQLREMIRGGMAVGAHTHSHRVLSTLEPQEQQRELVQSKNILEERLKARIYSLAYPVGRQDSFGALTKRLAREAGYELAFSFYPGVNRPGRLDPFDLRRSSRRKPFEAFTAAVLYPGHALQPVR